MMKNTRKTKRTFKVFAAWDYEFEEREFNRMSEQGWQLVNGGSFSQKYEYDDSVIYRYQLDYNNEIKDMARYDETFRDAGWERVNSTANGWHIFRKAYDKSLPDEEYEIYTDEQSRVEMLKRWRNVCFIFICIVLILSAWYSMREFVESLAKGEGNFYDGWMKNPMSAMISCNDGFRPFSFYIEVVNE